MTFLVTTTGTQSPVVFGDLGGRALVHPVVDLDLSQEYTIKELVDSQDLRAALDAGYITIKDDEGNVYTTSADLVNFTETHSLRSHSDVSVVSPAVGHLLAYDGTKFVNQDRVTAGVADRVHTHDAADIVSGSIDPARVPAGAVTQYTSQIDHNQLLNYDPAEHRVINDLGVGPTDLWSAQKIQAELSAITSGLQRRKKVIDVKDPTQPAPVSPNVGDRYILDNVVGTIDASWGTVNKNDIVEWDGAQWVGTTPVEGWVTYVDVQNRDYVFVNDGTPKWEARNSPGQSNLDDLADVVITTPTDDEVLAFDTTTGKWINQTRAEANIADRVHTHVAADITDFDAAVSASPDVAANTASRHDAVTLSADTVTTNSLSLTGQQLTANLATTTTDGVMSASDKLKLDGIEANAEVNAATNIGTAGIGVFKDKVGSQLRFKKINPATVKISVVDDVANDKIDVDLGQVYLQDLQDVAALSPSQGDILVYNGTQFADLAAPGFIWNAARNSATTTNVWLRKFGDIPTNRVPFITPFDADIIAISIGTDAPETWTAEVYKNADIVSPPTSANAIISIAITNADSFYQTFTTPVQLVAGDRIGIYCNGSNINRPSVSLYIRRRA